MLINVKVRGMKFQVGSCSEGGVMSGLFCLQGILTAILNVHYTNII